MISRNQIVPRGFGLAIAHALFMLVVNTTRADTSPQTLPFTQNWTNTGLITTSNDWSGVPGIIGYRGDDFGTGTASSTTGVDPQTVLADMSGTPVNVQANQTSPNTNTTGGLGEFEITNPVVAFQGSATADAPNLVISLNTTGQTNINVSYNLRDIDGAADNAIQPVALQYRVGSSGNYTNIPAGYVADATTGPSLATLVTPVSVTLPAACNNQPLVQLRILTTNAVGSDEWVGVDDISITGASATQLLSINDVSQNETDSGATTFAFTVSLSLPAGAGGVTFDICTQDNTATVADGDYVSNCLTSQTIPQGSQTYQFNVTVNGDTKPEPNETFFVNVTNISNATGSDTQGLGTIVNDDVVQIHDIQGSGNTSPLAGQTVMTTGIVTGVRSNGFFIQAPDASADADPATSEGIFVFTSSTPPAGAAVGNAVLVTGTVQEFIPSADPFSPSQTEISGSPVTTVQSTGNTLPAPHVITMAETQVNDLNNLEKYEGMRVQVNSLTVVAPTQGNISEANATSTSNGVFYGVVTGVARPFREPGIEVPDPVPTPYPPGPAPANVPRFDFNPERLRASSCALAGSSCIDVTTGATLTNIIGPLDYGFRTYTIDVDPSSPPVVAGIVGFVAVPAQLASELTVSSFNMQRFFDTVNDPSVSDVVLTTTAFNNRLNKASLAIRNVLLMPDVIGVEEMENLTTLQAIADKVNADAGPGTTYQAFLAEGNDVGGIDVGFLVKTQANGLTRITVNTVTQYNKAETYIDPDSNSSALLNDRPPLVLRASVDQAGGGTYSFTVIANHLRSLSGIDDLTSAHTRVKRQKQAESLATLIHSFETVGDPQRVAPFDDNIVSVGDYNSFEFNDGYVDVVGTVLGTPAPGDQVVQPSATISTGMTDLIQFAAAGQKYSYTFDGDAQALDHELANSSMVTRFTRLAYGRMDADYPEAYRNDPNRPEKLSDHDPSVAYFDVTPPPPPAITASGPTTFCDGGSVTLTSSGATGNQWYRDASAIGGATGQQYVATISGDYTVAANGSNPSAPTRVTVNPIPPKPTITPSGQAMFCTGGSVTLTSSNASSYQWYLNSSPISGATSQQYNATAPGNYTVVVTENGCDSNPSDLTRVTQNSAPVAADDTATVNEDSGASAINVLANDTDSDGDTKTITAVTQGAHGSVAITGGGSQVSYTPAANYNGTDTFTYTISDGICGSATASVNITINAVNDAPVANAQSVSTNEDTAKAITLTGSDVDNDPLIFTVVTNPTHGTLSGTPPNLTYTPTANYNGPDSFTFKANDGQVDSANATISITVNAVNDAPSFTKGADQTVNRTAGPQTVSGWATNISAGPADESGQTLTFVVTNNNNGIFSSQPAVSPNGTLIYTPASGSSGGSATVTVTLQDNGGTANGGQDTSAPQTFTITVTSIATPTLTGTASPASGNVGTSFTDTATLSGGTNPTGTITFTAHGPNTENCATAVFTSVKTVNGNGNYTSDPFTPTSPGSYKFVARYSGDTNNTAVATTCGAAGQSFVVNGPSPTPTPTPTATPAQALNISTRMRTELGDKAMIGGFIITGNASKSVVLRGLGPSLSSFGLSDLLLDPELELRGPNNNLIFKNKNWKDDQRPLIEGTNFEPKDDRESVIVITLNAGAYTALLTGKDGTEGIGLVEIYDTNQAAASELGNISTRGMVRIGDKVMIGGFTLGVNNNPTRIAVRGRGPSLSQFNLSPVLADPTLELRNQNGTIMISNDDWQSDPISAGQLTANGLGLSDPKESGIFISLAPPGQFTAILAGKNGGIGIGLIEVYNLK